MSAKIVIDARTISSSSGRYVYKLIDYLQHLDNTNKYKVLLRPQDSQYWQPNNPNWQVVEAPFADFSFDEQLALNRLLKRLKPDLVHFCFPQHPILYRGKFVVTIHDLTLLHSKHSLNNFFTQLNFKKYLKAKVFQAVFKRAANKSSYIITPTDYVKQDLLSNLKLDQQKVIRIYEAADRLVETKPSLIPKLTPETPFILSVSNGLAHKNNRRLIAAHQRLLVTHPNLRLAMVGRLNAQQKELRAEAKRQNWRQVIFTGFVSDNQLVWAYQHARAYVFPSLSEGFGLPGLEAMQFDLPLISSRATCLPEVYGRAAHYFDPRDVAEIARAIDQVLSDGTLRKNLLKRATKRRKLYGWYKTAEATLEVYQKALSC